jgi:hypothetical protein
MKGTKQNRTDEERYVDLSDGKKRHLEKENKGHMTKGE